MKDHAIQDFKKLTKQQLTKIDNHGLIALSHKKALKYTSQRRRALDIGSKFGFYAKQLVKDFTYVDCFDMRDKMLIRNKKIGNNNCKDNNFRDDNNQHEDNREVA